MAKRFTTVYPDQIHDDLAGLGLSFDTDDSIKINVDDSTVEINLSNVLQVKDEGITEAKLDIFNDPSEGFYLRYTSDGLKWVDIDVEALMVDDIIVETPTGDINGSNKDFELSETPVKIIGVFYRGFYQSEGSGEDYQLSGTTLTFAKAPHVNSTLFAVYIKA